MNEVEEKSYLKQYHESNMEAVPNTYSPFPTGKYSARKPPAPDPPSSPPALPAR